MWGMAKPQPSEIFLRRHIADIRFVSDRKLEIGVLFDLTDSTIQLAPIRNLKSRLKTLISQHGGERQFVN